MRLPAARIHASLWSPYLPVNLERADEVEQVVLPLPLIQRSEVCDMGTLRASRGLRTFQNSQKSRSCRLRKPGAFCSFKDCQNQSGLQLETPKRRRFRRRSTHKLVCAFWCS